MLSFIEVNIHKLKIPVCHLLTIFSQLPLSVWVQLHYILRTFSCRKKVITSELIQFNYT